MAYMTRCVGGEFDNTETVRKIVDLRIKMSKLLGYRNYAEYALEEKMAKDPATVGTFLKELLVPSLPYAEKDVGKLWSRPQGSGNRKSGIRFTGRMYRGSKIR